MMDFFADDLFADLDLVGEPLDVPVDVPGAEAVAGPDWFSDLWFGDLDPGLPDAGAATDLPLPDPFQSGVGAAGLLGSRFARAKAAAKPASRVQNLASALQIADTSASLAQRLAGLRRTRHTMP